MSPMRDYEDLYGEVVGIQAYVNIPNPNGGSYLKRKCSFRYDV